MATKQAKKSDALTGITLTYKAAKLVGLIGAAITLGMAVTKHAILPALWHNVKNEFTAERGFAILLAVLIVGGLVYSAPTVHHWVASMMPKSKINNYKTWGMVILSEGFVVGVPLDVLYTKNTVAFIFGCVVVATFTGILAGINAFCFQEWTVKSFVPQAEQKLWIALKAQKAKDKAQFATEKHARKMEKQRKKQAPPVTVAAQAETVTERKSSAGLPTSPFPDNFLTVVPE